MTFEGRWRIVEMELWDNDAIDLLGHVYIEIRNDDQGASSSTWATTRASPPSEPTLTDGQSTEPAGTTHSTR